MILAFVQFFMLFISGVIPTFEQVPEEVFTGVENRVVLNLKGCDPELVEVKLEGGSLLKRSDTTYSVIVQIPNEEIKLKLYYKKILCEVKIISSSVLPEAQFKFEHSNNGYLSVNGGDSPGKLEAVLDKNYPGKENTTILSYLLTMVNDKGARVYSSNIRSDKLDTNALNQFKKLMPGAKIIVTNVSMRNDLIGVKQMRGPYEFKIQK